VAKRQSENQGNQEEAYEPEDLDYHGKLSVSLPRLLTEWSRVISR